MSAKGCSPDNAAMEGFFGLLKGEFWHGRDWSGWTPARFIEELGGWIGRYNTERRSDALGGRTPAEFRATGKGRVTVQEIVRSPEAQKESTTRFETRPPLQTKGPGSRWSRGQRRSVCS